MVHGYIQFELSYTDMVHHERNAIRIGRRFHA